MKRLPPHGQFWVSLFSCLQFVAGCALSARELRDEILKRTRTQAGEKMVASPDQTARQYPCTPQLGFTLAVEEVEAVPETARPGEEVNHHLRYALCNPDPSRTIAGRIVRILLFRGAPLSRDITPYEFKPGTWEIDVFIRVPLDADSGVYGIQTVLEAGPKTIQRVCSFAVTPRAQ